MSERDKIRKLESILREIDSLTPQQAADITSTRLRGGQLEVSKVFGNTHKARDIAMFLNQVKFLWDLKGKKPFYKFVSPCAASALGDSWEEDLNMSDHDFRQAKNVVSTSVRSDKQALDFITNGTEINTLVVYRRTSDRVTYWYFNEALYAKLLSYASQMYGKKRRANSISSNLAQFENMELGPIGKSGTSYNTERQQIDNKETEKESKKEKDEDFTAKFESESQPVSKKETSEKKRQQTKEKANKSKKPQTYEQQQLVNDKVNGKKLVDFSLDAVIMERLVEQGYIREQLEAEVKEMVKYWNNRDPDATKASWGEYFETFWVPRSKTLSKNGQVINKDANTKRAERLRELATSSVFDRVGTRDIKELTKRLRGRGSGSSGDPSNP